ncbi:MAG TPA: gamma-glutamylcyclotransferase [Gemmatimonadales bacterium]
MASIARTFDWIVRRLRGAAVPFQLVGGAAARAYGATRPVVDLDFYVPDEVLAALHDALTPYAAGAPSRVVSDHWDVACLAVTHEGQAIELGGADSARFRRGPSAPWNAAAVAFDRATPVRVFGVTVPVMARDQLLAYKKVLGREVDLLDCHELSGPHPVPTRLAVYGSLAPGAANHRVVASLRGSWEQGSVYGRLHPEGWGMTYGFPGLVWHPDGDRIPVTLLTSADLPGAWERLDVFEGEGYRRAPIPVTVSDGTKRIAQLYLVRERS